MRMNRNIKRLPNALLASLSLRSCFTAFGFAFLLSLSAAKGLAQSNPVLQLDSSFGLGPVGTDAPASGTWDIVQGGQIIATNSSPANWQVSYDNTANQFTIYTPSSASVASGFEVRYAGTSNVSAIFDTTAGLQLTSYASGQNFQLSTFAKNFPHYGQAPHVLGPLGIAFYAQKVLVADVGDNNNNTTGHVRVFPNDKDGQDASTLSQIVNYSPRPIGLATLNGNIYLTTRADNLVQINTDGTLNQTLLTGLTSSTGLLADPFRNVLYVSSGGNHSTVWKVDPTNPSGYTVWLSKYTGGDGMALSVDGKALYISVNDSNNVVGVSTSSPTTEVFNFDAANAIRQITIAVPDGIAVGKGSLAGKLYVNANDGNLWEINTQVSPPTKTAIATGGTRGDFVTVDPNGTLLLTQSDRVLRLTPPSGGGFVGAPSDILQTRDSVITPLALDTNGAWYIQSPWDTLMPSTSNPSIVDTTKLLKFDLQAGVTGTTVSAQMQRAGNLTWTPVTPTYNFTFSAGIQ